MKYCTLCFRKLRKMAQNLSSAAVFIGAKLKVSHIITEAYHIADTNLFPLGPSCDLVKPGGHVTLGHLWLPLVLKHMISGLLPQRLWPSAHSSISEIIEQVK